MGVEMAHDGPRNPQDPMVERRSDHPGDHAATHVDHRAKREQGLVVAPCASTHETPARTDGVGLIIIETKLHDLSFLIVGEVHDVARAYWTHFVSETDRATTVSVATRFACAFDLGQHVLVVGAVAIERSPHGRHRKVDHLVADAAHQTEIAASLHHGPNDSLAVAQTGSLCARERSSQLVGDLCFNRRDRQRSKHQDACERAH